MTQREAIVVIGAGIGGLTTAALLAQAGLDVTVLEAHVYPGGCAGTFFHKAYRFEAGATLAGGFYPGGPMDIIARSTGITQWPAHPSDPSMLVHLPGGERVTRYGDERRWAESERAFGAVRSALLALAGGDGGRAVGSGAATARVAATDRARRWSLGSKWVPPGCWQPVAPFAPTSRRRRLSTDVAAPRRMRPRRCAFSSTRSC